MKHESDIEQVVVGTTAALYKSPADAASALKSQQMMIGQSASDLQNQVKAFYQSQATRSGVTVVDAMLTDTEKLAARTFPERAGGGGRGDAGGGGGGGGRGGAGALDQLSPVDRAAAQAAFAKIPQHMDAELTILVRQKKSVMEIRDFLSGEFEPLPLADLMDYFRAEEKIGAMKLTVQPEPAAPAPVVKGKKPVAKKNGTKLWWLN